MDLEYKIKGSTGKPQVVRVEFDPQLLSYDEVKPRLLSMKADADEALGTVRPFLRPHPPPPSHHIKSSTNQPTHQVKAPQIAHFEVPFQIWTTASLLLFLTYTTLVPQHSTCNFWWLARVLRYDTFPDAVFPAVWAFVCIVHVAEGAYAATLARKHNMPWHIAVRRAFLLLLLSS